jgi:hypothetical protein
MSFAIGHFAFGATLTALLVTFLLPRIPYPRTAVLVGGVWAMVPDAAKLAPASSRLVAFHDSPWADVFWLHGVLDRFDAADSPRLSALLVAVLLLVTVVAEHREYRASSRVRDAYEELDLPTR